MSGWTITFALLAVSGAAMGLHDGRIHLSPWMETASMLFGLLFVVSLAARMGRDRA